MQKNGTTHSRKSTEYIYISLLVHISQAQQDQADKSFYLNES